MTNELTSTAKQIVKEYYDLFDEKPIIVNMGDREIVVKRNGPLLHPHYKELANGNIPLWRRKKGVRATKPGTLSAMLVENDEIKNMEIIL